MSDEELDELEDEEVGPDADEADNSDADEEDDPDSDEEDESDPDAEEEDLDTLLVFFFLNFLILTAFLLSVQSEPSSMEAESSIFCCISAVDVKSDSCPEEAEARSTVSVPVLSP